MCEICRQWPCDYRCPNGPEPVPVYKCDECGEGIFEGDEFYDGPDGRVCKDCLDNMSVMEFMKLIGEELRKAG